MGFGAYGGTGGREMKAPPSFSKGFFSYTVSLSLSLSLSLSQGPEYRRAGLSAPALLIDWEKYRDFLFSTRLPLAGGKIIRS
jgi:hypothetical protein